MIYYVVLHYQNIEVTRACVASILNISSTGHVVIVDNASPNGSGDVLSREYSEKRDRVTVIINRSNQGFSAGNNIGFKYAKDNGASAIVVMNNDVIIHQQSFEDVFTEALKKGYADIIGPDVITPEGRHQNPINIFLSNWAIIKTVLLNWLKSYLILIPAVWRRYVGYRKQNPIDLYPLEDTGEDVFDCVLHGSIVIYGPRYIANEWFAFVPVTYMYNEEHILFDYIQKKSYRTAVIKRMKVMHLGGASTLESESSQRKLIFRYRQSSKSLIKMLLLRLCPAVFKF